MSTIKVIALSPKVPCHVSHYLLRFDIYHALKKMSLTQADGEKETYCRP